MSDPIYRLRDRVQLNSMLIVLSFVSVLLLSSQSAGSYATYLLALSMLLCLKGWDDVLHVPLLWLVAALLGYLFLSSFWSQPFAPRDAFSTFVRALLVFLFVVAVAECRQRGHLRRWLERALALAGAVAVVGAMGVFYAQPPLDGRLNGLGQLDTHVVAALVFGGILIFTLDLAMTDRSRPWRVFAAASAVVVAYAIFLTDSRNAWFSAMIGVGVYALARQVKDPRRFAAGVAALAVLLGVLVTALVVNEATRDLVLPRGDSFRISIWADTAVAIREHALWFGFGINTPDEVVIDGLEFLHSHNLYLSVTYQGGLVALTLFGIVLAQALITLLRHYNDPDAKLALGMLGMALPAYLLDGHELVDKVGSSWFLLWLPVAISLGLAWDGSRRGSQRLAE